MSRDDIVIAPMPPLVTTLLIREQQKGSPLTEGEVLAIRDGIECVAMPRDVAAAVARNRGYDDIDMANAWIEWTAVRRTLTAN